MTELTPQEKYKKLVEMGKLPRDDRDCYSEYLNLALELAEAKTKITDALKTLEGCCDKDECCIFTDDGVCYDDDCLIAEAKTILNSKRNP